MALTTTIPSTAQRRHFPLSERQRLEVLSRIDAAERETLTAIASEGTRSVQAINEGLRTGTIRLQPDPTATSMTPDPLRLHGGAPTLRVIEGSRRVHPADTNANSARQFDVDSAARLRQMLQAPAAPQHEHHPHRPPALTPFERRSVLGVVAIYLVSIVSAAAIWAR